MNLIIHLKLWKKETWKRRQFATEQWNRNLKQNWHSGYSPGSYQIF